MNPRRWRISRFLPVIGTYSSTILRSASFCLLSLSFTQLVSAMLPFKTFKTHSIIQLKRSLSQFDVIALRNFGRACFST